MCVPRRWDTQEHRLPGLGRSEIERVQEAAVGVMVADRHCAAPAVDLDVAEMVGALRRGEVEAAGRPPTGSLTVLRMRTREVKSVASSASGPVKRRESLKLSVVACSTPEPSNLRRFMPGMKVLYPRHGMERSRHCADEPATR